MEMTTTRKVTTFEMEGGSGGGRTSMTSITKGGSGGGGEVSMQIVREGQTGGGGKTMEISKVKNIVKVGDNVDNSDCTGWNAV